MKTIQEIYDIANNCLNCKNPTCKIGCPINNPIPEVLMLIKKGKISEAESLLFENSNATLICSKLCDFEKNCKGHCVLAKKNKAIPFHKVEEFLSSSFVDYNFKNEDSKQDKIAIIGAGISGISLAIDLAKRGFKVTLFEKRKSIGGVVTDSLPSFRFNDDVIKDYLEVLKKLNVEIKYNKCLGTNLLLGDLKEFKAIVFAMGTEDSKTTLNKIDDVVYDAMELLKVAKTELTLFSQKKVLVIGGGNVAIDIARTLKKVNNDVKIVYRRNKENAPSSKEEIKHSLDEGIDWIECFAPVEVKKENNKVSLIVEKMNLVKDDNSSRLLFEKTNEFDEIKCDIVVEAIGTNANYDYLKAMLPDLFEGKWPKDEYCLNNQYYFVTGDYYLGATSFVEATKQAKKTAERILELCK